MEKLELTKEAKEFHNSLAVCMKWLGLGGHLALETGHTIAMSKEGKPGFLATRMVPGEEDQEIIFQIGSETAWMCLLGYAEEMTDEERTTMSVNIAFNRLRNPKIRV